MNRAHHSLGELVLMQLGVRFCGHPGQSLYGKKERKRSAASQELILMDPTESLALPLSVAFYLKMRPIHNKTVCVFYAQFYPVLFYS